ncbi:MAG: hypothetical protein ACKV19_25730 [Verrucomicrobiales bacterium]
MGLIFVTAFLALLFLASVINQLSWSAWETWVARIDIFGFLPHWKFFAPDPGYTGNHLVYRDGERDSWGAWTEVEVPTADALGWLWNPARSERKALLDLINSFIFSRPAYAKAKLEYLSEGYLGLLAWAMAQPRQSPSAKQRQFAVIMCTGHGAARRLQVAFSSAPHGLD